MTSKEKLLQLRHDFYNSEELNYDSIDYFTTVEKDLEVLEILKKYITEMNKFAYFDEKTNKITTLKIISMIDLRPENNDYKTIKEWLNDKQRSIRKNNF